MAITSLIFVVLVGLSLGSFVNALVWRLHESQSIKKDSKEKQKKSLLSRGPYSILDGRSMCPNCHHVLAPRDLIPVVSWLLLSGKCRYCHKPISWQYPVVELVTAVLVGLSFIFWSTSFNQLGTVSFVLWLIILTGFMALSVYDIRWYILPDQIVYSLIVLAFIETIIKFFIKGGNWSIVLQTGLSVLVIAGLFYLIYFFSQGRWMGFGDVKLAIALGILVGSPLLSLMVIFLASLIGSLVTLPLLLQKKLNTTSKIPFGPFLLLSAVIVVLFGVHLIGLYKQIFYLS